MQANSGQYVVGRQPDVAGPHGPYDQMQGQMQMDAQGYLQAPGSGPNLQALTASFGDMSVSGTPPAGMSFAPMPRGGSYMAEEMRTIFITGFPLDARDRELNNFLRFLPGYEASQLTTCKKTGQSQGFALFATAAHARSSVLAVSGILFDENCVLRAELAYKNLVVSDHKTIRPMRAIALSNSSDHGDQSSGSHASISRGGGVMVTSQDGSGLPQMMGGPAAGGYGGVPVMAAPQSIAMAGMAAGGGSKESSPCNTLFLANLGDNIDDGELRAVFGAHPGFKQLKVVRKAPGQTVAFIEYTHTTCAMQVKQLLQGCTLASSGLPIRIEFSRNPFGKRLPLHMPMMQPMHQYVARPIALY